MTTSGGGGLALQTAEVTLGELPHLGGIEVSNERRGHVVGGVVGREVVLRLREAVGPEVGRPTDHRPGIRVRFPEHGVEQLVELTRRRRFGAQAPLFVHHVPLGVELAEDGAQEAVRLHPEPELELVGGYGNEVNGLVLVGEGVHPRGTEAGVDLVELVFDHQLALLFGEGVELLLELDELGRPCRGIVGIVDLAEAVALPLLAIDRPHLILEGFLLLDNLKVAGDVRRPDGTGALEHHVLEEVAEARDAGPFVRRADVGDPAGGDGRELGSTHHENLHPVRELEGFHRYFGDIARFEKAPSEEPCCEGIRQSSRHRHRHQHHGGHSTTRSPARLC